MKKLLFTLFIGLMVLPVDAQIGSGIEGRANKRNNSKKFGSNRRDAIYSHSNSHYRPWGWFVNPGLTYMVGNNADDDGRPYDLTASGLPGYYLEAGMCHLMKKQKKIIHYFDWGLGVKHYGGQEKYEDESGNVSRGQFNFGSAFLRANVHNVIQLNMWNFIDQGLGLNVDYRLYGGNPDDNYGSPLAQNNQGKLVAQLNYSFGFGIKPRDGFFIVPSVRVPILTAFQFNDLNPSHTWFQSRYLPLAFTIKFAWLFPKKGCPDVYDNGEGEGYSNQYQNQ
ncbi:MAG: hypothetical protein MK078_04080 [Crocinitomicaceae bacterium]|nr:hypothetical protein [Crocinitomicaceae bacterium]